MCIRDSNHHRASDDAATVGYMLIPFWKMLHERGIHTLQAVNKEMEKLRPLGGKSNRFPKHIILIAKNKVGLKNLYQMISASNLKYFKRVPIIPKSLLNEHRAVSYTHLGNLSEILLGVYL